MHSSSVNFVYSRVEFSLTIVIAGHGGVILNVEEVRVIVVAGNRIKIANFLLSNMNWRVDILCIET
ncbi:hypothetical protein T05_8493 [Trichinella murrelli]|uniref:Uncharacterized protein n=1 Tax=Trichinella murrelli TaxID=144512 RepID=A0A0V0U9M9_9BILA|nr:hypothetical protein T05_8493 [Trichinella murrelli]